jgi:5S rRNA maturation endonuclease (ribonuclease M5)
MFEVIKSNVDLKEVISKYANSEVVECGTNTYQLEDKSCPFCGHNDCFKVKDEESEEEPAFYKCFSCDETGDAIGFVGKLLSLTPREAALKIAKDFSIQIPNDYSPAQEIFNLAADYYHNCLVDESNKPMQELLSMTPLEYQTDVRKHSLSTLTNMKVGWSDGKLVQYLDSLGFSQDLLIQTGLVNKKGTGDFLPHRVFIYAHLVKGRVSHFTFKDPMKVKEYQLPNKFQLNQHTFYGQDTISTKDTVIMVEGENDLLSVMEDPASSMYGVIGSIGQLSGAQVQWVVDHLSDKNIITIFDSDDAGDKYRAKMEKVRPKLKSLVQVKIGLDGVKDIDECLKKGLSSLPEVIKVFGAVVNTSSTNTDSEGSEVEVEGRGNIILRNNCYYKIRWKDGLPIENKLTNFKVDLKNIFIQGEMREREVQIIREDGRKSRSIRVTSEVKVSLKAFKALLANAIDASFYGREDDLATLWDYIYATGKENEVHLPTTVGRIPEFKGWLFRNCFISETGKIIEPDKDGIMWLGGTAAGIKPVSLDTGATSKAEDRLDIPFINCSMDPDEVEEMEKTFVLQLARNLGDIGMVLTMMGWIKMNVYSDFIHRKYGSIPFLFFWGRQGEGKTHIARWLLSLFNMEESGFGTVPTFKSGVGYSRKIAYYASLPMILDEIRSDRETVDLQGTFRTWFHRASRDMGTREGFGIRSQLVKSNFIFVGQDQFADSATRQRCVPIRIPIHGRETVESYAVIEDMKADLSAIGAKWIVDSTKVDKVELIQEILEFESFIKQGGCKSRTSKNWASVGYFAKQFAEKYFPTFDFTTYVSNISKEDTIEQEKEDMVLQFFNFVETLQVGERPKITVDHMRKEGNKLYIWFPAVFNIVQAEQRGPREDFSKGAILGALREEKYFVAECKKNLGLNSVQRRVTVLDLDTAPETVQNIANFFDLT